MTRVTVSPFQPLQCEVALRSDSATELASAVETFKRLVPHKWRVYHPERRAWHVLPTRRVLGRWLDSLGPDTAALSIDPALLPRLRPHAPEVNP